MADFDSAVAKVLAHEGGLSNDPVDHGGMTAYGISALAHPEHADAIKAGTFTLDDAKEVYRKDYWSAVGAPAINDQWIAEEVFDCAVNQGVGFASRILQVCLVALGAPVVVDGKVGPKTVAHINGYRYPDALLTLFRYYRVERYLNIVKNDPSQGKYLAGWLRRIG